MKKVYNKKVRLSCYNNFKKLLYSCKNKQDVRRLEIQYKQFSDCFIGFEQCIELLLKNEYTKLDKQKKEDLIRLPKEFKPLIFNLDGLNELENKINKINNPKLKYEFKGLFNLLSDRTNLVYNNLYTRKQIIKDLNKFKSLKFFKVNYISRYDLKSEYKSLSFKNDCTKNHTKVYFIKSGLYVLKTLKHDDLNLKVFYIGKKYKTLLKPSNTCKKVLKGDKFNLSSVNAYKTLDKRDNMRYYSYCNDMGLNKSNRDLLRSIRSKRGKKSFYQLLEDTEDRIDILNDKIYQYYNSNDEPFPISDLVHYEWELKELESKLYDWTHEDNSMSSKTELGDYSW